MSFLRGIPHLMRRVYSLESKWLKFCRATFTVWVMTSDPSTIYLWKPNLGDGVQPRQLMLPWSLALFPVGLPHGAFQLQGEGPLEERC